MSIHEHPPPGLDLHSTSKQVLRAPGFLDLVELVHLETEQLLVDVLLEADVHLRREIREQLGFVTCEGPAHGMQAHQAAAAIDLVAVLAPPRTAAAVALLAALHHVFKVVRRDNALVQVLVHQIRLT